MATNIAPPRGMRDFLPADKAVREGVMAVIRQSFASFGFREIETPVTEELSRLTSGQGGDNEKLIFQILRRGLDPTEPVLPGEAADLGLRFDLTVPLTRFYASHRAELPAVFRSIQMAPVWRAERPQKGRYRQFTQCDIDVLGEASELAEVELITATLATVGQLGIANVSVRLNDRRVLLGLLDDCGFAPQDRARVLVIVDKLDKIGLGGVADELRADGAAATAVQALLIHLDVLATTMAAVADGRTGGDRDGFDATLDVLPPPAAAAAAGLTRIRDAVVAADPGARLVADPTLVRGMGYYTGPIFELSHPSSSSSIGGGGRYDGMIGRFTGTDVPGCGFSIGFERIVDLVDPRRFAPTRRQVALVHGDVGPGVLVAWQRRLIAEGANVRLVARIRNVGRLLDGLAAEGFDAYALLDAGTAPPGEGATDGAGDGAPGGHHGLELRPLLARDDRPG